MLFRIQNPSPPLRPFIENLWYHEGIQSDHALERLLPDGAIELIFDLTDTPEDLVRLRVTASDPNGAAKLALRPAPPLDRD